MASIGFKRIALTSLAIAAVSASCMGKESLSPATAPRAPQAVLSASRGFTAYPGIVSDFEYMARIDGPAVVTVKVSRIDTIPSVRQLWPPAGSANAPFLGFFEEFSPPPGADRGALARRHASGFIISPDGDILTDAGDVAGASRIAVTLADGQTYHARLIGSDPASGVALLHIHATGLPVARIGSPAMLKAGEWVASIGSPYGLGTSIVKGVVSNLSRLLPDQSYVPLIQTDLTEHSGDGGSPLLNLKGEVVGIEMPPPDDGNVYQGLAFAIPIDKAMKVERQLKLHGKAVHGQLGVSAKKVTAPLAKAFRPMRPNDPATDTG
ncbi:trypsin-like peptidase domain-containing protein [Burkholderia cepacia]|uniref:S1C family serine protease n=1 Tax=Burkholderia TaxID=32008 RepID=UPI0006888C6A|nr:MULTISPECIES: trypsin-like peptidase domain-containing protein [Burkholderia]MDN7444331.1 trypsin-like peptidase domain-containing protein [Burkholderia cepacia]